MSGESLEIVNEYCLLLNDDAELKDYAGIQDDVDHFGVSYQQESREVYYGRLCTLIVKAGTTWIRSYTLNKLPTGYTLDNVLKFEEIVELFKSLKKKRIIQAHQYHVLYPDGCGSIDLNAVDMTLWVILARNLTVDRHMINWDATPGAEDDLPQYHIIRYTLCILCLLIHENLKLPPMLSHFSARSLYNK